MRLLYAAPVLLAYGATLIRCEVLPQAGRAVAPPILLPLLYDFSFMVFLNPVLGLNNF